MESLQDRISTVRDVAAYIRKSRGEDDSVLDKHRVMLQEIADRYGWRLRRYEEIGSADSIEYRPAIQELLRDVRKGLYDAVLVVDLDRLSRGDVRDQAAWRSVFQETGTLIIVPPGHVIDLNSDEGEMRVDIESLLARWEYKQIKKRLYRGKVIGAKEGQWTNGPPPYPYVYNRVTRQLELDPDETKVKTYLQIKRWALEGVALAEIAHKLNREGIPSPRGGLWSPVAVMRLITSPVHMGYVTFGKTSGSGHKNRKTKPLQKKPKEEWIVSRWADPGDPRILKTEEEHAKILAGLESRKIIPHRARKGEHPFSGLVRCGRCGRTMQWMNRANGSVYLKTCQATDALGNRICRNGGVVGQVIFDYVQQRLSQFEEEIRRRMDAAEKPDEQSNLDLVLEAKRRELKELEQGYDRAQEEWIAGRIRSRERYEQIINKLDKAIREVKERIAELEELKAKASLTDEERLRRIQELREGWMSGLPAQELNRLLRRVIDRIIYTRDGDDIHIEVVFL